MVLELTVKHLRKRRPPKMETLAFKVFKTLPKSSQSVQNALKSISKSQNQKNPEESEEKGAEKRTRETLNIPKPRQTGRPVLIHSTVWSTRLMILTFQFLTLFYFVILFLHFLVEIPNFLCPIPREI